MTGILLILTGCGPMVPVVRMDQVPSTERQAAQQVQVFILGVPTPSDARVVGPVQAHSCKHLLTDPPATQGDALQQLQLVALRAGANAIGNVTFDARGTDTWGTNCWQSVTASGMALRIERFPVTR
jgi:hypothetical protein